MHKFIVTNRVKSWKKVVIFLSLFERGDDKSKLTTQTKCLKINFSYGKSYKIINFTYEKFILIFICELISNNPKKAQRTVLQSGWSSITEQTIASK